MAQRNAMKAKTMKTVIIRAARTALFIHVFQRADGS